MIDDPPVISDYGDDLYKSLRHVLLFENLYSLMDNGYLNNTLLDKQYAVVVAYFDNQNVSFQTGYRQHGED
mgnify:CR=1 FL=1